MVDATLRRLGLAFRIGWFLRGIPVLVLMAGCAGVELQRPCTFWVKVRVMDDMNADIECRRLGARRHDNGDFVKDNEVLRGCAPFDDTLITNGEEWVGGHELDHKVKQFCRKAH